MDQTALRERAKKTTLEIVQGIVVALICTVVSAAAGAWIHHAWTHNHDKPDGMRTRIVGPSTIQYAGQYAAYHVDVPGKDASHLILTWTVEPVHGQDQTTLPVCRPTGTPGEVQLDSIAGRWRLFVSVVDPHMRSGEICSLDVTVPESPGPCPPGPSPTPQPAPGPLPNPAPIPAPVPPLPPAPDNSKFSSLVGDVQAWLAQVTSPDKASEVSTMIAMTNVVITSLSSGTMSHQSGLPLRIAVASAVLEATGKVKDRAAWASFGEQVNASATASVRDGKLSTATDWADFLTAFVKGLGG